jgi:hypothetical protein
MTTTGSPRFSGHQRQWSPASQLSHAVCLSCLILQRFGYASHTFLLCGSLIIVPPVLAWLALSGKARVAPGLGIIYGVMLCCFFCSVLGAILFPDYGMRFSILSIAEILVLYTTFILSPAESFDTQKVFDVFIFYARLCAIAGIVQFALQFAHLKLFTFSKILPGANVILLESGYNTVAPLKYGASLLRSNGFFFLEPSLFSQTMALAIVVDYFARNKVLFLPLYLVALLSSFSGTGVLALAVTMFIVGLTSPSQIHRTILIGVMGVIVTAGCALAFPEQFATLTARASGQDASAHLRYGLQLEAIRTLIGDPRALFGFGPGAADGFAPRGTMGPALKLLFDYGLIGTLAFVIFFLAAVWRSKRPAISIVCLTIFILGGGNLLFPPILFLIALLCIWGQPVPTAPNYNPGRARFVRRPPVLAP